MGTGLELVALAGTAISTVATINSMSDKPPGVQPLTQADKPQATKAPDRALSDAQRTAGLMGAGNRQGNAGTFLTGPMGVDPSNLNLGRNTLLGE